jgi:1-acyl-sn-glycerol-3-phosphate acyltransferase
MGHWETKMVVVRSAIFWILLAISTGVIGIWGLLILPFRSQKLTSVYVGDLWFLVNCMVLRYICGVKVKLIDEHNIPTGACLVVAKHQSIWETLYLPYKLGNAAFVCKKELLSLPVVGWYLRALEMIPVDRKGGLSAIRKMTEVAKKIVKDGRKIVIFPEGTRVAVGESVEYKPGVVALYNALSKEVGDILILPVALNSGEVWPRKSWIIKSGTIKVKFLKPITKKMSKRELLTELKEQIDSATNSL